jgi:partitioning defective protein 6
VLRFFQQFEAEFRRYGLSIGKLPTYDEFVDLVKRIHKLHGFLFTIWYTDPEGDLLPLSNNDNFAKALTTAQPLLRVIVLRKGRFFSLICAVNQFIFISPFQLNSILVF